MRGLVLIGVVMAACTMDNPQFVPGTPNDGTTGGSGSTSSMTTTGSNPTSDPTLTSAGATSGTSTDPTTATATATSDPTMTGGTDTGVQPGCGDGVLQPDLGEACDDGVNNAVLGHCDAACTATLVCGDSIITPPEACDDGNNQSDDGCDPTCVLESCGDGKLDVGEECDDGNPQDSDMCTNGCLHATCGDLIVQDGVEACDDGNLDDADACLSTCAHATCGDGVVHAGVEECDDANDIDNDACTNACKLPKCGDAIQQAGEACDDGNALDTDPCLSTCKLASCGDGFIQQNVEQCDLGPGLNKDGGKCTSKCLAAKCGDGLVHIGTEQCDDGNMVETDVCTNACMLNFCLRSENGNNEEIKAGSFDACVQQQMLGKKNVAVALLQGNNLVYSSRGQVVGNWSMPNITSSKGGEFQYDVANHDNLITLKNGDKLMITGHKSGAAPGCWQSMGDGYGIVVYPAVPDSTKNPKLMVLSYRGGVSGLPRLFPLWTFASEISWNGGRGMSVCEPMGPKPATGHVFFMHVF